MVNDRFANKKCEKCKKLNCMRWAGNSFAVRETAAAIRLKV